MNGKKERWVRKSGGGLDKGEGTDYGDGMGYKE